MWAKTFLGLLGVALLLGAAYSYGSGRWDAATRNLHRRLDAARVSVRPAIVDVSQLAGMPEPVQRYFRAVLQGTDRAVTSVVIEQTGELDIGDGVARWRPFRSRQRIVVRPPGFDWDARVAVLPLVPVRVRDAYVAGEGILHAAAPWYPTALLPSPELSWTALGDQSARATLVDGPHAVSLRFDFDADGLIATVSAEARGRTVGNQTVPTPWTGRFWNYVEREGLRIPCEAEVSWIMPAGPRAYWRGRIAALHFEWTG